MRKGGGERGREEGMKEEREREEGRKGEGGKENSKLRSMH